MLKSRYFTAAIIVIIAFFGLSLMRLSQPITSLNAEINHVDQKLAEVQQKNEDLARNANNLNNESYLERQVRLKLNYKKADEEAVQIYKTPATAQQMESNNFFVREYHKLTYWFKNLF